MSTSPKFAPRKKCTPKQEELKGYLEKNVNYIIDYERRKLANKTIGSGRMEKRNDILVARRQKGAGMAWSGQGAWNLALVAASFPSLPASRRNFTHEKFTVTIILYFFYFSK